MKRIWKVWAHVGLFTNFNALKEHLSNDLNFDTNPRNFIFHKIIYKHA